MRRHPSIRAVVRANMLGMALLLLVTLALALVLSACGGGVGHGEENGSRMSTAMGTATGPTQTDPGATGTTPTDPGTPPADPGATGTTPTEPGATGTTPTDPGATATTPSPPASGDVDPDAVRVVNAWATTLARGDVAGAAKYFALPSAVANGGRPVQLTTRAQLRAFNRALPCGAELVETRAAGQGFFVATFRLLERPGGDCGSGVGGSAQTAIHVTDGLIDHWLRVQDLPPATGTPS